MKKVLVIVDDHPEMNTALVRSLNQNIPGLEVLQYKKLSELMEVLKAGNSVNLVLMDGYFGRMLLGPSYTSELLTEYPDIVVAGYSSEVQLRREFMERGAKYFVLKASRLGEVIDQLKLILLES